MSSPSLRIGAGLAAAAAIAAIATTAAGTASAVDVTPFPNGVVGFSGHPGEWWTCVAGSLAWPYVDVQFPHYGLAPQFAQFTQGIDVGVACAGTETDGLAWAKIVRPGR
jgi:hypothetical protein